MVLLASPTGNQGGDEMDARALIAAVLIVAGCASANSPPPPVRLVKDAEAVKPCKLLGVVTDTDTDDLVKKARKLGSDTVLITGTRQEFHFPSMKTVILAEAYRCA